MWPVIFEFGPVTLYSFGVFLLLAVVLGLFVSWKKIREYHIEDQRFLDASLQIIFWGLVGARLIYILENFSSFGFNALKWVWFTHYVGLSMWGGILGGVVALVVLNRFSKWDLFEWLDIAALGLALGLSVGRVASLLNGSNVGRKLWFGNLPTQLLETLFLFLVFIWLWKTEPNYRTFSWYRGGKSSAKSGFLWFMSLICFGVIFIVSSFGYQSRTVMSVVWPILCLLAGSIGIYWRSGRSLIHSFRKLLKR